MPKVKLLFGNYLRFNEKLKELLYQFLIKNLKPLLNILKKNKVEIISSGGTYKIIRKLNLMVQKYLNILTYMKF